MNPEIKDSTDDKDDEFEESLECAKCGAEVYGMYDDQALCFGCLDEIGVWRRNPNTDCQKPVYSQKKERQNMFPEEDREWSVSKQAKNILEAVEFLSESDPKDLASTDWLLFLSKTRSQLTKLDEALAKDIEEIVRCTPLNLPEEKKG